MASSFGDPDAAVVSMALFGEAVLVLFGFVLFGSGVVVD